MTEMTWCSFVYPSSPSWLIKKPFPPSAFLSNSKHLEEVHRCWLLLSTKAHKGAQRRAKDYKTNLLHPGPPFVFLRVSFFAFVIKKSFLHRLFSVTASIWRKCIGIGYCWALRHIRDHKGALRIIKPTCCIQDISSCSFVYPSSPSWLNEKPFLPSAFLSNSRHLGEVHGYW